MANKWISVTGSRYYPFTKDVWNTLEANDKLEAIDKGMKLVDLNVQQFHDDWGVVSGGAKGPDTWAITSAVDRGLETVIYEAEWEKYGKGAGFLRNKLIAKHADSCLVFWDGESNGTNHFIKQAYKLRREMFIVGPSGDPWAIFDEAYWAQFSDEPPRMDIP